jgi:hypothetical protein
MLPHGTSRFEPQGEAGGLCPDCGQPHARGGRCPACQWRRDADRDVRAALSQVPPLYPRFSLATLLMATTWIAVCLGALRLNTCLGMLLIFLTLPALLRTMAITLEERESGAAIAPSRHARTFLISLGIMFSVLVASGAAFAFCVGIIFLVLHRPLAGDELTTAIAMVAMAVGLLAAVGVAGVILWSTRSLGGRSTEGRTP